MSVRAINQSDCFIADLGTVPIISALVPALGLYVKTSSRYTHRAWLRRLLNKKRAASPLVLDKAVIFSNSIELKLRLIRLSLYVEFNSDEFNSN